MSEVLSARAAGELAFARARARLLDVAFQAELAVIEAIAAYLGQDAWRADLLREKIIGPLSVQQRLKILFEIMDREQWHDDLPFVQPVLQRIFEVRNQLAHSMQYLEPVKQGSEWIFSRYSYRRGTPTSFEVSLAHLSALVALAQVVIRLDLHALLIKSVPETYWLDPSPPETSGLECSN